MDRLGGTHGSRSERARARDKQGRRPAKSRALPCERRGGREMEERRTKCEGTTVFMVAGKAATRCGGAPCPIGGTPNPAARAPVIK